MPAAAPKAGFQAGLAVSGRNTAEREFLRQGASCVPETLLQGAGCEACRNTGYRGRVGVSELLVVDDTVRDRIQQRANASQIRDTAIHRGMTTSVLRQCRRVKK